jgi:hypothetical protein
MDAMPFVFYEVIDGFVLLSQSGQLLYSGHKAPCEAYLTRIVASSLNDRGSSLAVDDVLARASHHGVKGEEIVDLLSQWEDANEFGHVVNLFLNSADYQAILAQVREHRDLIVSNGFQRITKHVPPAPGWVIRGSLLLSYHARKSIKRVDFLWSWIGLLVIFFLLAALSSTQGGDQNGMQNKRGIIFFLLSCAMHVNTIFIEAEVSEYRSFIHMRNNNYFSVPEYFTATVMRLAIPRVLFSLLGGVFTAIAFQSAVELAILLGLTSFAHSALMAFVVYWWPVASTLVYASLIYYAYAVMFSGFLICLTMLPRVFSALSLLRYSYGGAVAYALRGLPYSCDATNQTVAYCYTGNQYLELEGFQNDWWDINALILFIITATILFLLLVSMKVSWL